MDDQAFDRLTMAVSRLRERATRRGALKGALGAAVGAATLAAADDADARRRNRDRGWGWGNWGCRYNGTYCTSSNQCCNGSCRGNICGGSNYPGKRCGSQTCANGWKCCSVNGGVHYCTPQGYGTCCGNASYADGYRCCGGGGACQGNNACYGNGQCCPSGQSRCGSGCCFNSPGWRCRNGQCTLDVNAVAREGMTPGTPFTPDATDSVTVAPGEGVRREAA